MSQKQDVTEWLLSSKEDKASAYHLRQFHEPYRSTVAFCEWLERENFLGHADRQHLVDLGCGLGANVCYLGGKYPKYNVTGIDINPDFVETGNNTLKEFGQSNCYLEKGDLYKLRREYAGKFDGVVSFQTLSWLPSFDEAAEAMVRLEPGWIAMTSLFFDGLVTAKLQIEDYSSPIGSQECRKSFYNVYSLHMAKKFFEDHGFADFHYSPFEIDIDLERPSDGGMGTYTELLADGRRLQISGPVIMSWFFIAARR